MTPITKGSGPVLGCEHGYVLDPRRCPFCLTTEVNDLRVKLSNAEDKRREVEADALAWRETAVHIACDLGTMTAVEVSDYYGRVRRSHASYQCFMEDPPTPFGTEEDLKRHLLRYHEDAGCHRTARAPGAP